MAQKPLETGLSEMPEETVTNVIEFTPSGQTPSDLPPGHSADILQMDASGGKEDKSAADLQTPYY